MASIASTAPRSDRAPAGDLEHDAASIHTSNGNVELHNDEKVKDPNIVEFDGPEDPENPLNWTPAKKFTAIAIISFLTFLSPLASTIIAPATEDVLKEFGSTSETLGAFVTSVYLLGYVAGPLVIAPLSEMYGRSIVYQVCTTLFFVFSLAGAVANSLNTLLAFRFLAGLAGACPVTIGAGSIADMVSKENRGGAMAAWALGPMFGPSIGPIAGGYLTPVKGWRWMFWVLAMLTGVSALLTLLLQESYPYIVLKRKTARLQKETGNPELRSALDTGKSTREFFIFSILRPLKMLIGSPVVFLIALYGSITYSYLYLCFTTFPRVFRGQYEFSQSQVGLVYLGIAVGSLVGLIICWALLDRMVASLTKRNGGEPRPEYRLPTVAIGALLVPAGLFLYGWTAEHKAHWFLPILGTGLLGAGMVIGYMASLTYLVDTYTVYAASVSASIVVLRSLMGALLPLAGNSMYNALGVGWGTSVLGFIAVAFIPAPLLLYIYGARIREIRLFGVVF
ncbi:major facilitator superfamily domain-containing protein [Massariosphaeria phaeospora]|uniref:Major facilitator superfamily domain-containing protein n=1 Tax=Massariosphaeria phaeospora TaxID=100035 RepID=A0A7C8HZK5_9PLEO|nr:major facilitator superfamily domain-containing protein [Massariosphaeria phaeospora]